MSAPDLLPAPLVPPGVTIAGLHSFMLNVDRLFASELWAMSTGEEFKAAVALWGRAWQQNPAGSLPDDERLLAAFSGAGKRWPKVRDVALRGFVKCSDGRIYHRVLCEDVIRAAQAKQKKLERTAAASEARRKRGDDDKTPPPRGKKPNGFNETPDRYDDRHDQRNDERDVGRNDLRHEERNDPHVLNVTTNVTSTHRRDGTGRKKEEDKAQASHPDHRAVNAEPGRAEAWNSRANFDRVEARCRADLPNGGPQDLRISPMAKLEHEGYDLEAEIVPALLDIEASSRQPVRTWMIYAERCRERIDAARVARTAQGLAATPAPVGEMHDLGPSGLFADAVLRRFLDAYQASGAWFPDVLGPPPGQPGCRVPAKLLLEAA